LASQSAIAPNTSFFTRSDGNVGYRKRPAASAKAPLESSTKRWFVVENMRTVTLGLTPARNAAPRRSASDGGTWRSVSPWRISTRARTRAAVGLGS
jgi:hypothetical protein